MKSMPQLMLLFLTFQNNFSEFEYEISGDCEKVNFNFYLDINNVHYIVDMSFSDFFKESYLVKIFTYYPFCEGDVNEGTFDNVNDAMMFVVNKIKK